MKILIAGAGIGGLTAALCCTRRGMDVQVFEKAPELSEVGAGIQISPNAMRVFQKLGLDKAIIAKGFVPGKLEARMGQSGRVLFAIGAQSYGAPYVHIHRADLIEILSAALPKDVIRLGKTVTGYEQSNDDASLTFADGTNVSGDYLIGADGIHSIIRAQMIGPSQPRFTGNLAWRAIVPTERLGDLTPDPNATVWMSDKSHVVTYRLRGGALTNFVGIVERDDWQQESWTERGDLSDLKSDFKNWHPIIENVIQNIDPDDLFKWALFDRGPLPRWTAGRVTMLGDAVHPMLPFMAQGAAMAIEDGYVLADCLARGKLDEYHRLRLARTSRIQAQSRANMTTFHRSRGLGRLSYVPMWLAGRIAPPLVSRRFNWIYGFDATKQI